jgi:sugar phosphate isomerase/epimerase
MLLGARQECVADSTDLSERMTILKRFGYDFLELSLSRDEIASLRPESASMYQSAIEQTGLAIRSTSMGHFGGFAALPPNARAEIVRHIHLLMDFTASIGADTILLATREDAGSVDTYAEIYDQALRPLADEAGAAGVMLAFEHVGWYKPYLVAELVQAINHPAIGIYFDMGNCLYVGENPLEQARICAPFMAQLHIKGGPTTPLAAMPLAPMREILEAAGYLGRGCLEIPAMAGNRPLAEARGLLKLAGYC